GTRPETSAHAIGMQAFYPSRALNRKKRLGWMTMSKGRLEAFSDGVIAILITIMVLELKIPVGGTWEALRPLMPVFLTYVMSFIVLGIYWNNHHHMFHATDRVNGKVL